MHNQPQQPLDELAALRKENSQLRQHLRDLLSEQRIVKATVESIYAHEVDGDCAGDREDFGDSSFHRKQASQQLTTLEAFGVTLEENEEDETVSVFHKHEQWRHDGKPWLVFHKTEWEWQQENGKWSWEKKDTLFLEPDSTLE